jgi:hypothetical protein
MMGSDSSGVAVTSLVDCIALVQQSPTAARKFHLLRIPSDGADSFPSHVVESQALFLRLDIPHGDKTCTATRDQNMRDLLVPIQAFNIVRAGGSASESVGVLNVIKVGDV